MNDVQGSSVTEISRIWSARSLVSMASWQKYAEELKQYKDFSTENIFRNIL